MLVPDALSVIEGSSRWACVTADCRDFLTSVPEGTFDLIFGSPPYEARRRYGKLAFKLRGEKYVRWLYEVTELALRASKGLVCWIVQGEQNDFEWSGTPFLLAADLKRAGYHLRRAFIYYRNGISGSGASDWLRCDHEYAICVQAKPGPLPWSDNTACGHPPLWAPGGPMSHRLTSGQRRNQWGGSAKSGQNRRASGKRQTANRPSHELFTNHDAAVRDSAAVKGKTRSNREINGDKRVQNYVPPPVSNPGDVFKDTYTAEEVAGLIAYFTGRCGDVPHFQVGGNQMGHPLAHQNEAPFSLALADFVVRTWCPPDGLVYEPFCGSGTTVQACLESGRRCLATDLRDDQVALARRRCSELLPFTGEPAPPTMPAPSSSGTPIQDLAQPFQRLLFCEED